MLALITAVSLSAQAPELPRMPAIRRDPQVTYVDRTGAVIGVRGGRFGPPVDIAKLPPYVPAAFVAIEDRRFYSHNGVDPLGIGRAIVANIGQGRTAQGGSTITQQLARNLFLTQDRTMERKATEIAYALQLERTYSKKQILGLYLSRVYYGAGAYGLEAASRRYFNKPAAKLAIREAAMLAAVMKSPTNYNPVDNPDASAERAGLVLQAMTDMGAITPAQRDKAAAEAPRVFRVAPGASAQYFVDWVDGQTHKLSGTPKSDLVVETTLDLPLETAAAQAALDVVTRYQKQRASQAAVVALDGAGRVRVMIGGVSYAASPYNRATEARRQPGSAFKPFVYLAALEAGRAPDTIVVDEPVTINGWTPRNYESGFYGPITLTQALTHSVNTVAARLADEVGRNNVAAVARRLGVASPINTDPAMALGSTLVSPLELAQAYGALANGGQRVGAYGIERIRTTGGAVVWQRRAPAQPQVVANPALSDLTGMMRQVMIAGTGRRAAFAGADLAGKTGTTSDYKDAWFAGVTGNLSTVVWMGRDDNSSMAGITGGGAPAEMWRLVMSRAVKRLPVRAIPQGPPAPQPQPPVEPPPEAAAAPPEGFPPEPPAPEAPAAVRPE